MTGNASPRRQRAHLLVSGRVQAVGFRESARHEAERLGVTGWVANRRDGRVEIVAEGPPDAVDALIAWTRRGPPLARVDDVDVTLLDAIGEYDRFAIESWRD